MIKISLPPIANQKSKVLILGTMPGEQSLKVHQYYGHQGNQFWKIVFTLFNIPLSSDYEERKKLLLNHGIALWDVLKTCKRDGSSDNNITDETPNDFVAFFKDHPNIKTVFFASGKARKYYEYYIGINDDLQFFDLPSPSSANSHKTFDEKVREWQSVLKCL